MSRRIPALCLVVLLPLGGCLRPTKPSQGSKTVANPLSTPTDSVEVLAVDVRPRWVNANPQVAAVETAAPVPLAGFTALEAPQVEAPAGSVKLTETATVFLETDDRSPALGLIAAGTRVSVLDRTIAAGCPQAWLGVAPRGYVCAEFEDTELEPSTTLLPRVAQNMRIPGVYGRVAKHALLYSTLADARANVGGRLAGGGLMVRRTRRATVKGTHYWQTRQGWIAAKHIQRFGGSRWEGVELVGADAEGPALPLGWALPEARLAKVEVKDAPRRNGRVVRRLGRRERVELATGIAEHGYFALRDGSGFIEKARLAVVTQSERPEAASSDERWLDIDVSEQTLVAYEGDVPVYATLISSGKAGHRTPTGVYRLSRKVGERTMNSMADSADSYSVAKVPWTAYFATGYALHAAYWHDGFGNRKSHGCVNLSPLDARALYAWTAPLVRPGWTEVYGHEDQPGSVVQIRSRRDKAPATQGYAAAMLETEKSETMLAMR